MTTMTDKAKWQAEYERERRDYDKAVADLHAAGLEGLWRRIEDANEYFDGEWAIAADFARAVLADPDKYKGRYGQ